MIIERRPSNPAHRQHGATGRRAETGQHHEDGAAHFSTVRVQLKSRSGLPHNHNEVVPRIKAPRPFHRGPRTILTRRSTSSRGVVFPPPLLEHGACSRFHCSSQFPDSGASSGRGVYRIDGVPQMRRRPMRGLIDALRVPGRGHPVPGAEGFLPVEIRASGLRGGPVTIDARESSQMLSALLMVAPARRGDGRRNAGGRRPDALRADDPAPDGAVRPRATRARGRGRGDRAWPRARTARPASYAVEPDATAASYFAALPLVAGGSLAARRAEAGRRQPPGRRPVPRRPGPVRGGRRGRRRRDHGLVRARRPRRAASRRISPGSRTRSSRLRRSRRFSTGRRGSSGSATREGRRRTASPAMAGELRRLGQEVVESEDSLEIRPAPLRSGVDRRRPTATTGLR